MFDLQDAMADVVARSTQPALGAIKLAWWRERLEELDRRIVPAEPHLQAAARDLLPRGVRGADLARLEEGWAACLYDPPDTALLIERGARLFRVGAHLLRVNFDDRTMGVAGRLYAAVDASRRGFIDLASTSRGKDALQFPKKARPLTGLAALAARDLRHGGPPFEPEASPGRAWALLRHRITGRT